MKKEVRVAVVGLSHYMDDYAEFCRNLLAGSYVFVQHEPCNQYDEHALLVTMPDGKVVGYISGKCSHQIHAGVGEKMVMAKVIGGEHKSFDVSIMVDAEAYEKSRISTENDEIRSQLPAGIIGLRNVLPILPSDRLMEQAWTMIECGHDSGDEALCQQGVQLFAQHFGCSLCVEDQMRAQWIIQQQLDLDSTVFDRYKEMTQKAFLHTSLTQQIESMLHCGEMVQQFRIRYAESCTQPGKVEDWLDSVLDGQLRGCYDEVSADMASFIFYHKLSRADLYMLLSHLIVLTKNEKEEEPEQIAETAVRSNLDIIRSNLTKRLLRLTPYLNNIGEEEYREKIDGLFDLTINDSYTDARQALWNLLTKPQPRMTLAKGYNMPVLLNLVGYIRGCDCYTAVANELARAIDKADTATMDKNSKNISRAFDNQRYTREVKHLVEYYFT